MLSLAPVYHDCRWVSPKGCFQKEVWWKWLLELLNLYGLPSLECQTQCVWKVWYVQVYGKFAVWAPCTMHGRHLYIYSQTASDTEQKLIPTLTAYFVCIVHVCDHLLSSGKHFEQENERERDRCTLRMDSVLQLSTPCQAGSSYFCWALVLQSPNY